MVPMVTNGASARTHLDWGTKPQMRTNREYLNLVAAPNGKLYAIGGRGASSAIVVEEYDPATSLWSEKAAMPTTRHSMGVATAPNGKIYAIGGRGTGDTCFAAGCRTVEEYDPVTNTWRGQNEGLEMMPTARDQLAVAAGPNGKLYAMGGKGANAARLSVVEEYDPATNTWTTKRQMPKVRHNFGLALASNGNLFVAGGEGIDPPCVVAVCPDLFEYDPDSDTWGTRQRMSTERHSLGLAAGPPG
jgi:N-acetylneuraminic acid mutarotase